VAQEKLPDKPGVIRLVARELFEPEDLDEMISMCEEEAGAYAEDVGRSYRNQFSRSYTKVQLMSASGSRYVTDQRYRVFSFACLDRFEQSDNFVKELKQLTTQGLTAISQHELASTMAFFAVIIIMARVHQSNGADPIPLSCLNDVAPAVWEAIGG